MSSWIAKDCSQSYKQKMEHPEDERRVGVEHPEKHEDEVMPLFLRNDFLGFIGKIVNQQLWWSSNKIYSAMAVLFLQ